MRRARESVAKLGGGPDVVEELHLREPAAGELERVLRDPQVGLAPEHRVVRLPRVEGDVRQRAVVQGDARLGAVTGGGEGGSEAQVDDRLLEQEIEPVLGRVADRDLLGLSLLLEEDRGPLEVSREAVGSVDRGEGPRERLPDLPLRAVDGGAGDPSLLVGDERPLDRPLDGEPERVAARRGLLRVGRSWSGGDRGDGEQDEWDQNRGAHR